MKFGYARVSTKNDQEKSLETQIQRLKDLGCDEIFSEQLSGASKSKPQFEKMMMKLRAGDSVYVTRLDRLDRRMIELISLINEFNAKGVNFICLDQNIDTTTAMGRMMLNMFASFAQMERELTIERVTAGIAHAKLKGLPWGRPKSMNETKAKALMALAKSDVSRKEICKTLNISESVFYRTFREERAKELGGL